MRRWRGSGSRTAAPPAGTPVFIQVQGLAPTSVGLNGFIVAGDFTEGGASMDAPSGVTQIGGESGTISRDGQTTVGRTARRRTESISRRCGPVEPSWRLAGPARPQRSEMRSNAGLRDRDERDGRYVVGGGYYGTSLANACNFFSRSVGRSSGYVLLGESGRTSRADAISADGRVIVGYQQGTITAAEGVKWVDGRKETILGPLGPVGFARAVNRDGTLIAGTACTPDLPNQPPNAFAWTAAGGVQCYPVEAPSGCGGSAGSTTTPTSTP
jgi:hypothetical protein